MDLQRYGLPPSSPVCRRRKARKDPQAGRSGEGTGRTGRATPPAGKPEFIQTGTAGKER